MASGMEQCNMQCIALVPVVFVPPQKVMAPGQWSCPMTPTGMMTPIGMMTPTGAMTPTCHQQNRLSNVSTAVPSGPQTPIASGMMTPPGMMTPSGATTPTCHQRNRLSDASTAVPSHCEDNSDGEAEEDVDEACAELIAQIETGGYARQTAIEALVGSVAELAFDASACRVVQKAIELGEEEEAAALGAELQGSVREAIHSPHANHVLLKVVEVLPTSSLGFIMEEILGTVVELARHRYGRKVLCRLVQRHSETPVAHMDELIEEFLSQALYLARNPCGHHVIEMVLQTGSTYQRHKIFCSLRSDVMRSAKNRNATHVIEMALSNCENEDRSILVHELIGTPDCLISLVENQFGCHVAKVLLKTSEEAFLKMLSCVKAAAPKLQKIKYGRRLMEELKRVQAC